MLEELSLVSDENGNSIRKVPHSQRPEKTLSIHNFKCGPSQPQVKYTTIKDIRLQEDPRQIIFPDDFDGRIQIDVGK